MYDLLRGILRLLLLLGQDAIYTNYGTSSVERHDDFCRMIGSKGVEVSIVYACDDQYSIFGSLRDDMLAVDKFAEPYIAILLHNQLTDEDVTYVLQCVRDGW